MNPHDDGIGIDEYVDWLIEAGYPIERVEDFGQWVQRFEDGLRALPDRQAQNTVLPLLLAVRRGALDFQPPEPRSGPRLPPSGSGRGPRGPNRCSGDIPHVTREVIIRYATDLEALGLL